MDLSSVVAVAGGSSDLLAALIAEGIDRQTTNRPRDCPPSATPRPTSRAPSLGLQATA